MSALASALVTFTVFLAAQLVMWRLWRPAWQYAVLPALALSVLAAAIGVFQILGPRMATRLLPTSAFDYGNFVVLYGALVMAYFVTYPAVQADSPSMSIVLLVERAGMQGLSREELEKELNDQTLVLPRIEDLVAGNLVRFHEGRYMINPAGAMLARVHIFYRALLRMEKGG